MDEAEQVQDGNGVTILDLFNAVRKHVITAVVTLVIVMVAICAYTFTRTPQYPQFPNSWPLIAVQRLRRAHPAMQAS